MLLDNIQVGMYSIVQKIIEQEDTASDFGSGSIKNLLSTPAFASIMIDASIKLIDSLLPQGYITIGKALNINHLQPTTKGMTVTINTNIKEIKDNKIILEIKAYDEIGEIGMAYHERYVVNDEILGENIKKRLGILKSQP